MKLHRMGRLRCTMVLLAWLTVGVSAQEANYIVDLDHLEYRKSAFYPGIEVAMVFGDRNTTGLYATHARVSAGSRLPPHTHPNPLTTWVTSGTAYVGTGTVFDESALKAYPAGTYFVTPAGVPHFIFAKDGDFSILDHGSGPSRTDLIPQN